MQNITFKCNVANTLTPAYKEKHTGAKPYSHEVEITISNVPNEVNEDVVTLLSEPRNLRLGTQSMLRDPYKDDSQGMQSYLETNKFAFTFTLNEIAEFVRTSERKHRDSLANIAAKLGIDIDTLKAAMYKEQ